MQVTAESLLQHAQGLHLFAKLTVGEVVSQQDLFTKQKDVIVTSLLSWYSVGR